MKGSHLARILSGFVLVAGVVTATPATAVPAAPDRAGQHQQAVPMPAAEPNSPYVKKRTVIGRTAKGRKIRAWFRGYEDATRVLVVLGQMHGDEKAGIATAQWMRRNIKPRPGRALWVIPTVNPDGNARSTRTNARGVDLNRNWPTSGWTSSRKGSRYWGGPRPASERETRALIDFLTEVKPDYIASIHQPLRAIGRGGHGKWEKRLSRFLKLPRRHLGVGNPSGTDSPTMTAWYDTRFGKHGAAVTIEYAARTSKHYRTRFAGRGIAKAARIR